MIRKILLLSKFIGCVLIFVMILCPPWVRTSTAVLSGISFNVRHFVGYGWLWSPLPDSNGIDYLRLCLQILAVLILLIILYLICRLYLLKSKQR